MRRESEQGWLTIALIRAGTLASSAAVLAAVFATPVAAQPETADPADQQPNATRVERRSLTVEALGDSFFTGLGAGEYQRPDARRQSQAAGFLQALSRLEAANPDLDVTVQNHSSAGATIDDLYASQMAGGLLGQNMPINAPQLEGVNPNADVAIMGFGGNDVGFVDAIMQTFGDDVPLRNMVDDLLAGQLDINRPVGDYLADAARPRGQQETLIGELVRGIQEARRAMPNAQVVVTTYPEAVDPNSTSRLSVISSAELATFGELARNLNAAIRQAAALTGATVADNADAFAGHEVYTDDPYLHDLGPQWRKYDRDEAMHPNAAGQTAMSDAIADAIAKVTGLNRAAPYNSSEPYPTDGLTQVPRRPSRPTRTLPDPQPEAINPDKINWDGTQPPLDPPTNNGDGAGDGSGDGSGNGGGGDDTGAENPGGTNEDPAPPDSSETPDGTENPEETPPTNGDSGTPGQADNPENNGDPEAPGEIPVPDNRTPDSDAGAGDAGGSGTPENSDSETSDPADNPQNGGDRGTGVGISVPADNPENDGDGGSGPADNPENGGDRGAGSGSSGPADNPENGGDRDSSGSGISGPADNPENGGDRGTGGSGFSGPADNPENGGDRDDTGSGISGPADNPENGGDRGSSGSGISGPADNPDNGGDRGTGGSGISGPADNPENGGDRGTGGSGISGPADNPENGGDRGTTGSSWGGSDSGSSGDSDSGSAGDSGGSDAGSGGSAGGGDSDSGGSDASSGGSSGDSDSGSAGDSGGGDSGSAGDVGGSDSSGDSGGWSGRGPADNPENGGDRGQPSYGGSSGDPSTPMS